MQLNRKLCTLCGRPWGAHETDSEDDYNVGWLECTATIAIDKAQAAKHQEDQRKAASSRGHNPDRARQWTAWTNTEGPPSTA